MILIGSHNKNTKNVWLVSVRQALKLYTKKRPLETWNRSFNKLSLWFGNKVILFRDVSTL